MAECKIYYIQQNPTRLSMMRTTLGHLIFTTEIFIEKNVAYAYYRRRMCNKKGKWVEKMIKKWINKLYNFILDNIYISRMCLIVVMSICGLGSTYITNNDFKSILTCIAILGMTQGISIVFISIIEAKTHKKSFVVVLDLLMLVVIFAAVYCSIYSWDKFAFNVSNEKVVYLDLLYYSFVTLTTTGYGDVVPVSYIAKFTSAAESFSFACIISVVIINFSKNLNDKRG